MGPSDQLIYSSTCGSESDMNIASFVDSHDDNGVEVVDVKPVISDFNSNKRRALSEVGTINQPQFQKQTEIHHERISSAENTVECGAGTSFHRMPLPDAPSPTSTSSEFSKPLCQNFWKAGAYDPVPSAVNIPRTMAELLDNAVDEIENGATFVSIDRVTNPRDGSPALLIQEHQENMDAITVELFNALEAIVRRTLTQSVGLLSYTFLTKVGSDDIVVPMFDDIGCHGTKVIIYNLWHNDDGDMELDFDSDIEAPSLITTIGFLNEAPEVNIHGFNVYHKNRLILPFWQVLRSQNSGGSGVCGVLEANFIEPTHDKQGFEKSYIFQKLESRLKEMTLEYCGGNEDVEWTYCKFRKDKIRTETIGLSLKRVVGPEGAGATTGHKGVGRDQTWVIQVGRMQLIHPASEGTCGGSEDVEWTCCTSSMMEQSSVKYQTRVSGSGGQAIHKDTPESSERRAIDNEAKNQQWQEITRLTEVQNELLARCAKFENSVKDLQLRVEQLKRENEDAEMMCQKLLLESKSLEVVKLEKL
ncbi:hypothetical protein QJS04_geneDACA002782 [Acorus gramineus]|uniref:Morc S5 domain-containing protein n=1 Tax=Acorus gramineus TaxID=55184 RepID=A0AAV9BZS8_ACOGR|nr:hypothetical protein QJS04_geneDACA002782 [Acorus gramineus]